MPLSKISIEQIASDRWVGEVEAGGVTALCRGPQHGLRASTADEIFGLVRDAHDELLGIQQQSQSDQRLAPVRRDVVERALRIWLNSGWSDDQVTQAMIDVLAEKERAETPPPPGDPRPPRPVTRVPREGKLAEPGPDLPQEDRHKRSTRRSPMQQGAEPESAS